MTLQLSQDPNGLFAANALNDDPVADGIRAAALERLKKQFAFDLITARRLDLFIGRVFKHLKPGDTYRNNWLVRTMAWHLNEVLDGRERRLIINVPPRHLKSICTSVAFPAFMLGQDPTTPIILVCYSHELGEKMMRDLRAVMGSAWYKRVFPKTRLAKNTASEITTTREGGVNMTSVQGTLTGRGARIIIVDDPIKASDVTSAAERKRTNEWFQDTLFTRLDDKRTGRIVVAMQRLHEDDVTGHLTDDPNHNWTLLKVPAIADAESVHPILPLPFDPTTTHTRAAGSLIDPEREDHAALAALRNDLGSHTFAAQYQQDPIARDGNLVPRAWFRDYVRQEDVDSMASGGSGSALHQSALHQSALHQSSDDTLEEVRAPTLLPDRFDAIVASWDTASAAGANNDFSVGTIWGVSDRNYYLLDLYRYKLVYPSLKQRIIDTNRRHRVNLTLLEDADSGRNLYHDLRGSGEGRYQTIAPVNSKEDRLAACTAVIEEGRVYLPLRATWKNRLLDELMAFPNSRHDDQVDSLSMFINFMRKETGNRLVYGPNGRKVIQRKKGSRRPRI